MKRLLCGLLLWLPHWLWAMPQLTLSVTLDPVSRRFSAQAALYDAEGLQGFRLGPDFEIRALKFDGQPAKSRRWKDGTARGADWHAAPAGVKRIEIEYQAVLPPLTRLDHRQVLNQRGAMADPEGSFLPASSGWYPDPGKSFAYRVSLRLPAGQKGLTPGELMAEEDTPAGYRAEFAFPHPAEALDLMAGPYRVDERKLAMNGRTIRVRTWFHEELAPLAPGYLDDSMRYLARYAQLIGAYPFGIFSVVSSPTPTGYGMPTLAYLGRDVLKLPFIRATSLGHEVLHNWWGNGVYPDWRSGNWSEGLTTFLADYAYQEDKGEEAAREMRIAWLRDYAALPPAEDFPLKDFTARHHGIASIIGYNKAAMVFLMLRDRIGRAAFERGLKRLWETKRFQTASWRDLAAAFSAASGQDLSAFFDRWVNQPGNPTFSDEELARDQDFRLWRRYPPEVFPPILREVFIAPQAAVVITDESLRAIAAQLAARALDAPQPMLTTSLPAQRPALVIGRDAEIDAWLAQRGLARPLPRRGTAQVWAARDGVGRALVIVAGRDDARLQDIARALPHYGRQSWLVFEGARVIDKGVWPPRRDAQ
jgi:aminopeptidase N